MCKGRRGRDSFELSLASIAEAVLVLSKSDRISGKKHSCSVDKLEYLLVYVLRSTECRRGSMVLPAGKHERTGCARILAKDRLDQPVKLHEKGNRRREGWMLYLRVSSSHNRKEKHAYPRED